MKTEVLFNHYNMAHLFSSFVHANQFKCEGSEKTDRLQDGFDLCGMLDAPFMLPSGSVKSVEKYDNSGYNAVQGWIAREPAESK